jgi:tRNA threonylcarbamoyladenosine biosynthesis protein TsaB
MILTIHTTGMTSSIGLIDANGKELDAKTWESGRDLSDQLLAEIKHLIEEQGSQLSDLTGIIIFSGPGSFTSLRIGHTVANALADGLNIAVVGAMGEDWVKDGLAELKVSSTKEPALPFYGAEANITKPKH